MVQRVAITCADEVGQSQRCGGGPHAGRVRRRHPACVDRGARACGTIATDEPAAQGPDDSNDIAQQQQDQDNEQAQLALQQATQQMQESEQEAEQQNEAAQQQIQLDEQIAQSDRQPGQ
jgi:hypothetical protein